MEHLKKSCEIRVTSFHAALESLVTRTVDLKLDERKETVQLKKEIQKNLVAP